MMELFDIKKIIDRRVCAKKGADFTENSGWCHGNLGIIRSLMKVVWYNGDERRYQYYLDKFIAVIKQPVEAYQLVTPDICCGYGGIVLLQIFTFRESGDKKCLVNLNRNLNIMLIEHRKKMWKEDTYKRDLSFLKGNMGVVLAMQNSVECKLTYGKLLLID